MKDIKANEEFTITRTDTFKCPINNVEQSVVVYLLNERGEPLTGGVIPVCSEFPFLDPSEDTTTVFDPQQLRYDIRKRIGWQWKTRG